MEDTVFTILLILKGNMRVTSSQSAEKTNHGKQIKTLDSFRFLLLEVLYGGRRM